ncbi:glycine zipper 2TM domain-containing protein [Stenotrophomonas sp.]|uniref:glycine zipper 2TM domain-containing protein n=1 Tax=Stenotrophomonas sp. TaxID=69392 RepID=UPI0028A2DD9B|nr:glycine zipper 2TM domain-containing protein [Stenotrophomonas sp.]
MKLPHAGVATALLASAQFMAGCATHTTPSTFNRSEVGRAQDVQMGTIQSIRGVQIQNDSRGVPTLVGAAIGGVAGSSIGGGSRANAVGAIAGAAAGGAAGNALSRNARNGVEITVQLENGRTVAVVQDGNANDYRVGDRVRVSSDGTTTRVTR